jgi:hypothetical protein
LSDFNGVSSMVGLSWLLRLNFARNKKLQRDMYYFRTKIYYSKFKSWSLRKLGMARMEDNNGRWKVSFVYILQLFVFLIGRDNFFRRQEEIFVSPAYCTAGKRLWKLHKLKFKYHFCFSMFVIFWFYFLYLFFLRLHSSMFKFF